MYYLTGNSRIHVFFEKIPMIFVSFCNYFCGISVYFPLAVTSIPHKKQKINSPETKTHFGATKSTKQPSGHIFSRCTDDQLLISVTGYQQTADSARIRKSHKPASTARMPDGAFPRSKNRQLTSDHCPLSPVPRF